MAKRIRKRKCKNCFDLFTPDPRNAWHQKHCKKPECRKASKAESQKKWLAKEENRDYFRGPEHVERVRRWRREHPGYSRPKAPLEQEPLQDLLIGEAQENPSVAAPKHSPPNPPLQDHLFSQDAVLIGLVAHLTDTALQDHIVLALDRLQQLGFDIMNNPTQSRGESHDPKAPSPSTSHPKGPEPVQLGRSPAGP